MSSLVIIGAQWGDEGKGKLVDFLTAKAEFVARFQGGNNAGHTLVVGGKTTKLNLIPSGILRPHTHCVIGAGVVLDPETFISEIQGLKEAGVAISPERLTVDANVEVVLPYHRTIDKARELKRGEQRIGTTGRGIGPAYEDRVARCGVKFAELKNLDTLFARLEELVREKNLYLKYVLESPETVSFEEVKAVLAEAREKILPFIGDVSFILNEAKLAEKKIVFEGAQGTLLDVAFGTTPFVTSSHTIAGAVGTGCGVGPKRIDYVLGVAKAYCTRVGAGPFPTEISGEIGEKLRQQGKEFGTVTGRPRRCGWFDAVSVKHAVRLSGIDALALTKLDVLAGFEKIKLCHRYLIGGKAVEGFPSIAAELEQVKPEYIELDGWDASIAKATRWYQLPAAARIYLSTVSEIVGCPVVISSVGPDRESTIFSSNADYIKRFAA
jgi:adenylosuccinate synthase